jgi:subtilisin family serine protease
MSIRRVLAVCVLALVALLALAAPAAAAPVRKIVIFRPGFYSSSAVEGLKRHGATRVKALPLIDGAAVELPSEAAARVVGSDVRVLAVTDDIVVHALGKPAKAQAGEQQTWNIGKIGADLVWPLTTADPIKVGIVDTGIDTDHPDLAANVKGGVSCVSYTTSYNDDNGHGTHVAGIVAAEDNEIGVIGVAPKADLYAIKVLDRRGSGYLSDIITGLEWAVDNGIQVVNMSLGTDDDDPAFALAVANTAQAGVVEVCAAGNDGPGAVDYPGAYPAAIAVAATDSGNHVASWSSVGPQVAVAAPGVSVYSTYKSGRYTTMSGTSMASPHVAGTVALMLTQPNPGGWTPAEVKAQLKATALDLSPTGFDNWSGAGLVRANLAVAP